MAMFFCCLAITFTYTLATAQNTRRNVEQPARSSSNPSLLRIEKKCSESPVSARMFLEYGAVFAADTGKATLPDTCYFQNDIASQRFRKRLRTASVVIEGIRAELQVPAMTDFLAARNEAKKAGLDITLVAPDSAGRSYEDTVSIWRKHVKSGLDYWLNKKALTAGEAAAIHSLETEKQIVEILKLEKSGLYFGNGHRKSILESVAAPGYSQHLLFLALDISQHADRSVRAVLAKYGWFQTIRNDAPHFTYLGVDAAKLASRGLLKEVIAGRDVWTVRGSADRDSKGITKRTVLNDPSVVGEGGNKSPDGKPLLHIPTKDIPATMSPDVLLTAAVRPRLRVLTQEYRRQTGRCLHVTSGYRTPDRQALAMYENLEKYSIEYVVGTYTDKRAAWQVVHAYLDNRNDRARAVSKMTDVIRSQIHHKKYLSNHLLEAAFDIRKRGAEGADLPVLTSIVKSMGGELVKEKDHYHVEFR
jgi:D-alanyl-D-alanine carboxypeptidase